MTPAPLSQHTDVDVLASLRMSLDNLKQSIFYLKLAEKMSDNPMNVNIQLFVKDLEQILHGDGEDEGLMKYVERQRK
jgi:hypothetical protein